MIIKIDTIKKEITLEEDINLGDLYKALKEWDIDLYEYTLKHTVRYSNTFRINGIDIPSVLPSPIQYDLT